MFTDGTRSILVGMHTSSSWDHTVTVVRRRVCQTVALPGKRGPEHASPSRALFILVSAITTTARVIPPRSLPKNGQVEK